MEEPPQGWGFLANAMVAALQNDEESPERIAADEATERMIDPNFDMKLIPETGHVIHQRGAGDLADGENAREALRREYQERMSLPTADWNIAVRQPELYHRWFGPGEEADRKAMLRDAKIQSDMALLDDWSVSKQSRSHKKEKIREKLDRLESAFLPAPRRQQDLEEKLKQIKDERRGEKRRMWENLIWQELETDPHWSTMPRRYRRVEAMARVSRMRIDEARNPELRKRHWEDYKEKEKRMRHAEIERSFDRWREKEKKRFRELGMIAENEFRP
jgi:hypothetical protein